MPLAPSPKTSSHLFSFLSQPIFLTQLSLILLGGLLITLGTKINIPVQPIPVTLQSFAVIFLGMIYGVRLSVLAVLIYIGAACTGLPIFMSDLKIGCGYLVGFLLAAGLTGFLAERGWSRHFFSAMTAALLGTIVILLSGWIVLSHFLDTITAFNVGVKPFFLGGTLKIVLLTLIVPNFWKFMERQS